MTAQEIRRAYLDFFEQQNHKIIPRALLVPQNDPTTLFTNSGMQPLLPYLLGQTHPEGARLVDSQTCLRAQDIDEVGDNRHTTFFEMLGNWSLGDYFKMDEIPWLFAFLTDTVGLDPNRLYVTCYIGNEQFAIPKDTQAAELWQQQFQAKGVSAATIELGSEVIAYERGMQAGRIFFYDGTKNWWSRAGDEASTPIGDPGGPDTEVFFDFGTLHDERYGKFCHPNCDCGRFMEIANSVFMAYRRTEIGFEPLPKPNVDFGGGLERISAAALDNPDVFRISLLWPIIERLEQLSSKHYDSHTESMRVIADHLRAATFLAVDGVIPSNKEQGYVMRRLMRRAIKKAFDLGIEQNFLEQAVPVIADMYEADFPELKARREEIISSLVKEEKIFRQTLRKGLHELNKLASKNNNVVDGQTVFTLYDTYGYPAELTTEVIATLEQVTLAPDWREDFTNHMQAQRERSRTAAKGEFKGGLGGQTEQHKKYHTATHLLYQSLRSVLGNHVIQHGSNITEERLRFDFSHSERMTPEQIAKVEAMVNDQIDKDLTVTWEEQPTKQAREELHALGAFGDRYGETVKIYRMQAKDADQPFSYEICGGPHVAHTGELAEDGKRFKIIKEESSSAGIRRIKAVLA